MKNKYDLSSFKMVKVESKSKRLVPKNREIRFTFNNDELNYLYDNAELCGLTMKEYIIKKLFQKEK